MNIHEGKYAWMVKIGEKGQFVIPKEARELVKAAGFAWSPKMGSWNKGLTWKAYRAAQKLAADLNGLSRRAC